MKVKVYKNYKEAVRAWKRNKGKKDINFLAKVDMKSFRGIIGSAGK